MSRNIPLDKVRVSYYLDFERGLRLSEAALQEVMGKMKCHYHPRANAFTVCSACGVSLCRKCMIEDRDKVYCDSCYAHGHDDDRLAHDERSGDSEDYIDLELMDVLDTDDDEGLF